MVTVIRKIGFSYSAFHAMLRFCFSLQTPASTKARKAKQTSLFLTQLLPQQNELKPKTQNAQNSEKKV